MKVGIFIERPQGAGERVPDAAGVAWSFEPNPVDEESSKIEKTILVAEREQAERRRASP